MKKMIKREAKFASLFRHWLRTTGAWRKSAAFELKQTVTNSFPFSEVKPHQIDALRAVDCGENGLLYKIPDDSRGIKPFDFVFLKNSPAYIVIKYPKVFCVIDVDDFVEEMKEGKRKSLTSERAKKISTYAVNI